MSLVDKEICLKILKRGLQPRGYVPFPDDKKIYKGPAKDWEGAGDSKFLALFQTNGLSLDTHVVIWDQGRCSDGGRNYCIVY